MKRLSVLLMVLAVVVAAKAQYTIQINGSNFYVEVTEGNRTATIADYEHKIDDSKYGINKSRKIKNVDNTLIIPEAVNLNGKEYMITGIGHAAFANYKNFSYVVIPKTVVSIGDYAFFGSGIIDINIPSNVISIGKRAFGRCEKLCHISLPDALDLQPSVYEGSSSKLRVERLAYTGDDNKSPNTNIVNNEKAKKTTTKPDEVAFSDVDFNLPQATKEADDNTFVVIIANEDYYNEQKVDYAVKDGQMFKEYCLNVLGIPNRQIHFVQNATLNQMRQEINWLKKNRRVE